MIMGGLLGAAYFAKFFSVFALGPALVAGGSLFHNSTMISWGTSFEVEQGLDRRPALWSWSRCRPTS